MFNSYNIIFNKRYFFIFLYDLVSISSFKEILILFWLDFSIDHIFIIDLLHVENIKSFFMNILFFLSLLFFISFLFFSVLSK